MTRDKIINSQEYKKEKSYIDTWREGYEDAINKVYEWLASNLDCYVEVEGEHAFETNLKIHTDLLIEDLKTYMEE